MDGHDVRMVQAGCGFGFDGETAQQRGRGDLRVADQLDSHSPVQARLLRLINNSHASAADLLSQHVIAEPALPRLKAGFRLVLLRLSPIRHFQKTVWTLPGRRINWDSRSAGKTFRK